MGTSIERALGWVGHTFSHGVHPPSHKAATRTLGIRRLAFAPQLILPLAQHVGRAALPLVRPGQEVVRGEPVARADGGLSVPLHAPATGVVQDIVAMPTLRGGKTDAILLKVYPGDSQRVLYDAPRDVATLERAPLLQAIQDTGLVGLGGAGFPTYAKLSVPAGHAVDTLVVNGCECEPYLTTDHRVMLEWTDDVYAGIAIALRALGATRAIIGVENDKPEALAALRQRRPVHSPTRIEGVRTKYPQGSDKLLIKVLLGREVPSGGHAYDVGVVVQNVATLALLGRLLPRGQGLIERVVTVSGPGVVHAGNYLVPLGTPLRFLLDQVGLRAHAGEVIVGGPMMGMAAAALDVPITKGVSGVVVLDAAATRAQGRRVYACIHCGRCLQACPLHLNPSQFGLLAAKGAYDVMAAQYHLDDCFECGCCSYICPSNIPLVQYVRVAKGALRERAP
jgi:electron transport complex protein RnfC